MSEVLSYTLPQHLKARRAAQRQDHTVQILALVIAILCFAGAGILISPINQMRKEFQLVIDPSTVAGLPPDIALLGKLGTFRALAIDWASIRADRLKEEGKTYEALELHKTVCRLQPRFAMPWINAAWNMAYNISVNQYTPEARWQWVKNGIALLRDEGLKYNPRTVGIYKELAWIYWHKMGDFLDDEHRSYRRALAVEMELVLGARPIFVSSEEYIDWFKRIVEAPRDIETMIADDQEVAALVTKLEAFDLKPDAYLLEFVARNIRPEREFIAKHEHEQTDFDRTIALLTGEETAPAVERLLAALRSKVLREKYNLDPDYLLYIMEEEFGPLDLRSPFAHSLYWSSLGNDRCKGKINKEADAMNTARIVFYSMQGLVARGKIICTPNFDDPFRSYVEESTDVRFIPKLREAFHRLAEEIWRDDLNWNPELGIKGTSYFTGYVSHMHNWVEMLYYEGGEKNRQLAEEYFAWLRENNPHPDGSTQEMYTKGIDEFVMGTVIDQLQTYKQSVSIIRSFIRRSLKEIATGRSDLAAKSMERARTCYDYWMAPTHTDTNDRRTLQPIRILRRDVIITFIQDPTISPLAKSLLWKGLDLDARQMTYDTLLPYLRQLCNAVDPPWELDVAFREPPGMKEFRKKGIEYRGAPRDENIDKGERYKTG